MPQKADQRAEVNRAPQLEMIVSGNSTWDTHSHTIADAQSAVRGTTSTHLVLLSIMVNRCENLPLKQEVVTQCCMNVRKLPYGHWYLPDR
jgi:hypothetical protein